MLGEAAGGIPAIRHAVFSHQGSCQFDTDGLDVAVAQLGEEAIGVLTERVLQPIQTLTNKHRIIQDVGVIGSIVQGTLLRDADIHTEAFGKLLRPLVKGILHHRLRLLNCIQRRHLEVLTLGISGNIPEQQTAGTVHEVCEEVTGPIAAPDEVGAGDGVAVLGQAAPGEAYAVGVIKAQFPAGIIHGQQMPPGRKQSGIRAIPGKATGSLTIHQHMVFLPLEQPQFALADAAEDCARNGQGFQRCRGEIQASGIGLLIRPIGIFNQQIGVSATSAFYLIAIVHQPGFLARFQFHGHQTTSRIENIESVQFLVQIPVVPRPGHGIGSQGLEFFINDGDQPEFPVAEGDLRAADIELCPLPGWHRT